MRNKILDQKLHVIFKQKGTPTPHSQELNGPHLHRGLPWACNSGAWAIPHQLSKETWTKWKQEGENILLYKHNDIASEYFIISKKLLIRRTPVIPKLIGTQFAQLLAKEWGKLGEMRSFIAEQYLTYTSYRKPPNNII